MLIDWWSGTIIATRIVYKYEHTIDTLVTILKNHHSGQSKAWHWTHNMANCKAICATISQPVKALHRSTPFSIEVVPWKCCIQLLDIDILELIPNVPFSILNHDQPPSIIVNHDWPLSTLINSTSINLSQLLLNHSQSLVAYYNLFWSLINSCHPSFHYWPLDLVWFELSPPVAASFRRWPACVASVQMRYVDLVSPGNRDRWCNDLVADELTDRWWTNGYFMV